MTVAFRRVTRIAAPPEVVFDRSLEVDRHTVSMARSGERAVAGVTTGHLGAGDVVTWRGRYFEILFLRQACESGHQRHPDGSSPPVRGRFGAPGEVGRERPGEVT